MKFCKDCKFHEPYKMFFIFRYSQFDKCNHPLVSTPEPVTGKLKETFCGTQRMFETTACTPEGKLYEPK